MLRSGQRGELTTPRGPGRDFSTLSCPRRLRSRLGSSRSLDPARRRNNVPGRRAGRRRAGRSVARCFDHHRHQPAGPGVARRLGELTTSGEDLVGIDVVAPRDDRNRNPSDSKPGRDGMKGQNEHRDNHLSQIDLDVFIPRDHPLRQIRELADATLADISADLEALYERSERPEVSPEKVLRALLLQALYSLRSERRLMEQLEFNLLFRWFVGFTTDDRVWDATVFATHRDSLLADEVISHFPARLFARPEVTELMSQERFSVDGTLVESWRSIESFRPLYDPAPQEDGNDHVPQEDGKLGRKERLERCLSRACEAILVGAVYVFGTLMAILVLPVLWLLDKIESVETNRDPIIEDWEALVLPDHLLIRGTVSCHEGRVYIRLHEGRGKTRRYLGTATGTIRMHEFYAVAGRIKKPRDLSIDYTIEQPNHAQ